MFVVVLVVVRLAEGEVVVVTDVVVVRVVEGDDVTDTDAVDDGVGAVEMDAAVVGVTESDAEALALVDADRDADPLRDRVALLERDPEEDWVLVGLGGKYDRVAVTVEVSVGRLVCELVRVVEAEGLIEGLADDERVRSGDELPLGLPVVVRDVERERDPLGLTVGDRDPRALTVLVPDTEEVRVPVMVRVVVPDEETEADTVGAMLLVLVPVADREDRILDDGDALTVEDRDARLVTLTVMLPVDDGELAVVRLVDDVAVGLLDAAADADGERLRSEERDSVGDAVGDFVAVRVVEMDAAAVDVRDALDVCVPLTVRAAVRVPVTVAVVVRDAVFVAVDEALVVLLRV